MKFLAWFFAVIVFFSSFFVIFAYNAHQTFLTPQKTKETLAKVDFYSQIKSVLKKDLFETTGSSAEINSASKSLNSSLDQFNFQPKIETLISSFYQELNQKDGFNLSIDLIDFKNIFIANFASDKQSANEFASAIPNTWQVDMSHYSGSISVVRFIYRDYNLILIIFGAMVFLFLLFCLLVSFKYLKLFFWVFMLIGFFLLIQLFLWKIVNLGPLLANIESQGRSGVSTLVENFVDYFKQENIRLLFWETIFLIAPSLVGLIVVSVIPSKVGSVPLNEKSKPQIQK